MEKREVACESWNYGRGHAVVGVLTILDGELVFHPNKEPLLFWVKRQDIIIKVCDIKDLQPDGLLRLNIVMADDSVYTFRIYVQSERQVVVDSIREQMEKGKVANTAAQTSIPEPMVEANAGYKYCVQCGHKNIESANFCAKCGLRFTY